MTEYWVSQGNKWCDFCKIFISSNPASIRNHDLGTRHKENVAKRLTTMRKESAAKEKEKKDATRALEQIEAKAKKSYQKDVASFQARDSNPESSTGQEEWEYDSTSGYYLNKSTGLFYDAKSGFYYSDSIGKWVTQEEAYSKVQASSGSKPNAPIMKKPQSISGAETKTAAQGKGAAPPGLVVSGKLNPMRNVKGAPSSLTVGKRKREDGKPKVVSKEEQAALKAREAARKRVEEREKPLLGLYNGNR